MIQVYATDERDFINEHRSFKDNDIGQVGQYVKNLLNMKQNQKVVIKKFKA